MTRRFPLRPKSKPKTKAPVVKNEAHRQSLAAAKSKHAEEDQAWVDAVSGDDAPELTWEDLKRATIYDGEKLVRLGEPMVPRYQAPKDYVTDGDPAYPMIGWGHVACVAPGILRIVEAKNPSGWGWERPSEGWWTPCSIDAIFRIWNDIPSNWIDSTTKQHEGQWYARVL